MLFNKGFVETKCGTKEAYSSCLKVSRNERSAFCLWNGMAFDEEGLFLFFSCGALCWCYKFSVFTRHLSEIRVHIAGGN